MRQCDTLRRKIPIRKRALPPYVYEHRYASRYAYLVVAGSYGWKYLVLFEMDEDGVLHRQMKNQFKKAQAMGWIAAVAAAVSGRPGMAGAGMLAATRTSMYSDFRKVRKVKANRAMHTIYVNELLWRNQVYAEDADFDFVLHFIKEHTGK